ncbi:hypothetical protein Aperf_G00000106762 [Anoplocephala perfoliata]
MDILTSDDSILTDDSSASNRTFVLEDATFPHHTPVINGPNCDAKSSALTRGRTLPFVQCATKLGRLSLATPSKETPIKIQVRRSSSSSEIPLSADRQSKNISEDQPKLNVYAFKGTMGRSSALPNNNGWTEATSAFQRRKMYDDARRKSLHPSTPRRINPRRQASYVIPTVAKRREEAAAARSSIRTAARRALVNRNRAGLDG